MHVRSTLALLALSACAGAPADVPCVGLDADADGVCDRERADFSATAIIPEGTDRGNIYGLAEDDLAAVRARGLVHASVWPVDISGLLLPYAPMTTFFDDGDGNGQKAAMLALARRTLGFGTIEEMYDWLGLADLPPADAVDPYAMPDLGPGGLDRLGAGVVQTAWGGALTFSCATCHATELFGKTVVGLTNRHARANELFHLASQFYPQIDPEVFRTMGGANDAELALFVRTQERLAAVGAKSPEVLGLDTALAQVGLSLSRRAEDDWASFDPSYESAPRANPLDVYVADSKPAVWWNLKHKTRWLSDGAIVAGNPIFTNFLWNEIGRATDLHDLDAWLRDEAEVVDELTVAVFSTKPPRWTDFFDAATIDVAAAQRGEVLFGDHCASCHGTYEKGWDAADAATRAPADLLATTRVVYHETTPVMDVGTDGQRAAAVEHFGPRLNELQISKNFGTVVEVQSGYVPPPLEGIWARFPYLHNQSVPTLCALLSPADQRPTEFWIGPSDDAETDFDAACVGYPIGDAVPAHFKTDPKAHFDVTAKTGLSNEGHDAMLLDGEGAEILSASDKADLIAFLKTL